MTEEGAQLLREAKDAPDDLEELWAQVKQSNKEIDWDLHLSTD